MVETIPQTTWRTSVTSLSRWSPSSIRSSKVSLIALKTTYLITHKKRLLKYNTEWLIAGVLAKPRQTHCALHRSSSLPKGPSEAHQSYSGCSYFQEKDHIVCSLWWRRSKIWINSGVQRNHFGDGDPWIMYTYCKNFKESYAAKAQLHELFKMRMEQQVQSSRQWWTLTGTGQQTSSEYSGWHFYTRRLKIYSKLASLSMTRSILHPWERKWSMVPWREDLSARDLFPNRCELRRHADSLD